MSKEFRKKLFISRMRELMVEKHYSVNKLKELAGVSRRSIDYWLNEYETTTPNTKQLFALSKALNVSVDYLIGLDDNRHFGNKEIIESTGISEHAIEVLRYLKSKSGRFDGGMAHGPNTDTYSWKNVELINYVLEEEFNSLEQTREKGLPLPTVFSRMYDYIFSGELQYIHSAEDRDNLFGFRKKDGLDYDRIMFYNSLTETTMYVNANEMIKSILLDSIQNYLKGEADKQEKEVNG